MKKNLALIIAPIKNALIVLSIMLFVFSACKKDRPVDKETKYRELAWNYLSANAKTTVITPLQNAVITYETRDGVNVAAAMFNTTQDALLGPIFVYISIKDNKVLGIGARY
ncbi:hypothetical protein [Pedobacter frigiditerrae]|uniref:hypothetical protein n=1 Tax=Pedobacter frigiditerrae TaxID=2530452 RepID=UPI002931508E|nr:hypothetical protein [Pedobacter frigiditerrae]